MRRPAALAVTALLLMLGTGCGDDDKTEPTPPAACAGSDAAGSVHVLQSGPVNLPGGGRAVLTEAHPDASPPTARLSLLGADAGESTATDVGLDGVVTVQAKKYSVVQICSEHVGLKAQ
ncbi:MAG: hypothetical protein QOG10_4454 [Kribbellaceae bacterium]|nr:hypothetical protein [Kribbellaceae bacterium]